MLHTRERERESGRERDIMGARERERERVTESQKREGQGGERESARERQDTQGGEERWRDRALVAHQTLSSHAHLVQT